MGMLDRLQFLCNHAKKSREKWGISETLPEPAKWTNILRINNLEHARIRQNY
jgi:hypothetical protein